MTTDLLKAGLQAVRINVEGDYDDRFTLAEVDAAITEIELLEQQLEIDKSIWHNECYVVGAELCCDLMNIAAYDTYGKLAKQTNGEVTVDQFIAAVRKSPVNDLVVAVSDTFIAEAFGYLHDLWSDNDDMGYNNPDGTFYHMK